MQNFSTFQLLATSGRHNYAMITYDPKFTTKWSFYGMSSFHFTVIINSNSFPWAVRSVQERHLPKFSVTSNVRYWVNHVRHCAAWLMDMEEKQTELETENKYYYYYKRVWLKCYKILGLQEHFTTKRTRQVTLASLSRRNVTLGIVECRK